jgi:hypothetical protein
LVTQYIDRIDKERIVGFDDEALIKLFQIERRLTLLVERLEDLNISVDLNIGIVGVVAKAAANVPQSSEDYDYLTDAFGDHVREGTAEECRRFLRLMRDFLFALEHAEDLEIKRLDRGVGGVRDEEWVVSGGRELIARVSGGVVEWVKFCCLIHKQWLRPGGCEHA